MFCDPSPRVDAGDLGASLHSSLHRTQAGTRREAIAIPPARSLARSCQHTCRLFDWLQDVFPPDQLFLEVDNIAPGLDFVCVLNERVAECGMMLA
jgi:hypothetical protein